MTSTGIPTYFSGRTNLALTIFVPWDCKQSCTFCTSKISYRRNDNSLENVIDSMKRVFTSMDGETLPDVVFTGGEPFDNIKELFDLVCKVPSNRNIYINTIFPSNVLDYGLMLLNHFGPSLGLRGVNISRHKTSYEEDCKMFTGGIVDDNTIGNIKLPVRINCILPSGKSNQELSAFIRLVLNRWNKYPNVTVNFRADYRKITPKTLHTIFDQFFECTKEMSGIEYVGHNQCNVCFTGSFNYYGEEISRFNYHKGLQHSSITNEETCVTEINDIILRQDGALFYDWDGDKSVFEVATMPVVPATSWKPTFEREPSIPSPSCGSSSTSCGSSTPTSRTRSYHTGSCGGGSRC